MDLISLLPQYRSHKIVRAIKIVGMLPSNRALLDINQDGLWVHAVLSEEMTARYKPTSGDYYVIYDDGYASISPKHAFESGYMPLGKAQGAVANPPYPTKLPYEWKTPERPSDSKWP